MTSRRNTIGLLLANFVLWAGLIFTALYQLGIFGQRTLAPLPEILPLRPVLAAMPESVQTSTTRNGFDPLSVRWENQPVKDDMLAASGEIRGVMQLPGVRAIVTSNGTVKKGEPLAGGRFSDIRGDQVIIETESEWQALDLPGSHAPTLQSLSKSMAKPEQAEAINKGNP